MSLTSRRTAMARKRYKPEEIIAKLRQVDVLVSQGPQPRCRQATPHRRHGMVDQAISEHRATEGSADERCHHRVSQPGAAQPNRKCERFWTLPRRTRSINERPFFRY